MSKHTPGPWQVVKGNNGFCETWQVVHETPRLSALVADCGSLTLKRAEGDTPNERTLANARLIAAAPDLLGSLENLLNEYLMRDPAEGHVSRLALEHARNAIKKARGE